MSLSSITNLKQLQNTPLATKEIFYKGNLSLLEKRRIAIVGSRKPNSYAKTYTHTIAKSLAEHNFIIVSGGAIGVDAIAHKAATPQNTILVAANGLDIRYPKINASLIGAIEEQGLVLSMFPPKTPSLRYNFPLRNELVVALSEALIVTYADKNSGTMRSVESALKQNKPIFVLPHRLGESEATTYLLEQNLAQPIYSIEHLLNNLGSSSKPLAPRDPVLAFCQSNPTYEAAVAKFQEKIFAYELEGKITIKDGRVFTL